MSGLTDGITDITIVIENVSPVLANIFIFVKLVNFVFYKNNVRISPNVKPNRPIAQAMNKIPWISQDERPAGSHRATLGNDAGGVEDEDIRVLCREKQEHDNQIHEWVVPVGPWTSGTCVALWNPVSLVIRVVMCHSLIYQLINIHVITAALYLTWISYSSMPIFIAEEQVLLPANETYQPRLMYYILDTDKYYNALIIHCFFGVFFTVQVALAIDSMFIMCIQHACALFKIIRWVALDNQAIEHLLSLLVKIVSSWNAFSSQYRVLLFTSYDMESIGKSDHAILKPNIENDEAYHAIVKCIKIYNHATE